ncbi:hypothetical protein A3J43_01875 [Candidatus Uhrbacteria bacterium RIFCSPHIGHO2_12_FULL_54_23]|uniref:Undecaprenyldiphospho-muramoylpentapeptide beta-N-acetylglucosaminyltransferase n=1 Tax=Candidatus Uhrbacteria bacterium RIFCSPHIGHO2_12_FULL_54_23 TaxID=1802397 RepID=A0A1F7ULJ5_9BACT|nr:MAG: hypothetical protein A3J43_01875 [Candidatus Uhrbacteria bacterium RIFCSPHIGHO2_12_FULL_54_23]
MIMSRPRPLVFSGGGTMGSVVPLIALVERVRRASPQIPLWWIGTWRGVERAPVTRVMAYLPLCNGKFRRYASLRTLADPFLVVIGFFQSLALLFWLRPRAVVSAGAFVAVPLHWAAWVLRIPSLAIRLDATVGLAHRLIRACVTRACTVLPSRTSTQDARVAFPVRDAIRAASARTDTHRREAKARFGLDQGKPTLLAMGGGTGAVALNRAVRQIAKSLASYCTIIHLTGARDEAGAHDTPGYCTRTFLDDELARAYTAADLVVGRAGMGTIAECACMRLPMIVVPIPGSAQEMNAGYLRARDAAVVIAQRTGFADELCTSILRLLAHNDERASRAARLADAVPTDDGAAVWRELSLLVSL